MSCTERVQSYLEYIQPTLIKILESAPKYGSCGIIISFHEGSIFKVSTQFESTRLEGKENDD